MTDYISDGNIEWLAKTALVGLVQNDLNMQAITTNVRKSGDTTAARSMPGVAIDVIAEKTLPGVPEYKARVEFICETYAPTDKTGEQADGLVGVIRDILNGGDTSEDTDFLTRLNDQARDIVFHDFREAETFPDDEDKEKIRRRVIQADAWCYPGRVTA